MDSAKIGAALSTSQLHKPSLFQPFPQPPGSLQTSAPSLPPPLLPEIAPASVPELQPRQPAPYSMQGQGKPEDETEAAGAKVEEEKVHCPWCDAAFPAGGTDLESHVEQHLAQVISSSAHLFLSSVRSSLCYDEKLPNNPVFFFFSEAFPNLRCDEVYPRL